MYNKEDRKEGRTNINLSMHGQLVWGGAGISRHCCAHFSLHTGPAIQTQTLGCVTPHPQWLPERPLKESGDSLFNKRSGESISTWEIQHELSHTTRSILHQLEMHKALRPEVRDHRTSRKHKRKLLDGGLGNSCLIHHSRAQTRKARSNTWVCMRSIIIKVKYRGLYEVNNNQD